MHQLRSGPLLLALAIVVMVYECIGGKAETWLYHNSFPTDDPACSIHCLQNFYNHHSTHSAFKLKYQNLTCSSHENGTKVGGGPLQEDLCVKIWVKMANFLPSYDCFSELMYFYTDASLLKLFYFTKTAITWLKIGHFHPDFDTTWT